jgi:DNA-binding NtrC family response regulator
MQNESIKIDESVLKHMKSLTLLCVEDNMDIQNLYNEIFKLFFKKVISAENGEDGYEKYLSCKIDVVISDYIMPKLDGLGMIRKIRMSNKDIPIILITAFTKVDTIIEALQLNVNNFIKKPIETNEIINAITNAVKIIIANNYLNDQKNLKMKYR